MRWVKVAICKALTQCQTASKEGYTPIGRVGGIDRMCPGNLVKDHIPWPWGSLSYFSLLLCAPDTTDPLRILFPSLPWHTHYQDSPLALSLPLLMPPWLLSNDSHSPESVLDRQAPPSTSPALESSVTAASTSVKTHPQHFHLLSQCVAVLPGVHWTSWICELTLFHQPRGVIDNSCFTMFSGFFHPPFLVHSTAFLCMLWH